MARLLYLYHRRIIVLAFLLLASKGRAQPVLWVPWPGFEVVDVKENSTRADLMLFRPGESAQNWKQCAIVSRLVGKGDFHLREFMFDNASALQKNCAHHNLKEVAEGKNWLVYELTFGGCNRMGGVVDTIIKQKTTANKQTWLTLAMHHGPDLFLGQIGLRQDSLTTADCNYWLGILKQAKVVSR